MSVTSSEEKMKGLDRVRENQGTGDVLVHGTTGVKEVAVPQWRARRANPRWRATPARKAPAGR